MVLRRGRYALVLVRLAADAGRLGCKLGKWVGVLFQLCCLPGMDYGASVQNSAIILFGQWVQWTVPGW